MDTWFLIEALVVLGLCVGVVSALWARWLGILKRLGPGDLLVQFGPALPGEGRADERFARGVAELVEQAQRGSVDVERSQSRWWLREGFPVPSSNIVHKVLEQGPQRFRAAVDIAAGLQEAVEARAGRSAARIAGVGERAHRPDWRAWLAVPMLPLILVLPYPPGQSAEVLGMTASLSCAAIIAVLLLWQDVGSRQEASARNRAVPAPDDVTEEELDRLREDPIAALPHLVYLLPLYEEEAADDLRDLVRERGLGGNDETLALALVDLAAHLRSEHRTLTERRRAEEAERELRRKRRERAEFVLGWREWEERNGREVGEEEYRRQLRIQERERELALRAARQKPGIAAPSGGDSGGGG